MTVVKISGPIEYAEEEVEEHFVAAFSFATPPAQPDNMENHTT